MVCKLRKSIYGLRISAINWYNTIRTILLDIGFDICLSDNCIFFSQVLIIGIYVDDLIVLFKNDDLYVKFVNSLSSKLNIVDKGVIEKCLNTNVKCKDDVLYIDQSTYINEILLQFEMSDCRPVDSPIVPGFIFNDKAEPFENISWYQQLVGSLIYLANMSRPDIAFSTNILARYLSKPTIEHVQLAKRVLRYLKGTCDRKLIYRKSNSNQKPKIEIYVDADFGNQINNSVSITGIMTFFGDCLINWSCNKQRHISQSTCESEVIAILSAVNESEYFYQLLNELNFIDYIQQPFLVFNDNQSARMSIVTGGKFSANRHYRIRSGRIREAVREQLIKVEYCETNKMKADLLTKAFTKSKLVDLCKLINLID
jgi:hypothetical protein